MTTANETGTTIVTAVPVAARMGIMVGTAGRGRTTASDRSVAQSTLAQSTNSTMGMNGPRARRLLDVDDRTTTKDSREKIAETQRHGPFSKDTPLLSLTTARLTVYAENQARDVARAHSPK